MLSRRHFLIGVPLLALSGCSRKSQPEPLWIGHIAPLSGADRLAGENERNGILQAVKVANDKADEKDRKLAVIHADSRGAIPQARHEAVRLVSLNKVLALLGGREQTVADALGQALQGYPNPLVTPSARDSGALDGVTSLDVAPDFRGETLAKFAGEHLKVKKAICVVDVQSRLCQQTADAFARQWRSTAGQTVESLNLADPKETPTLTQRLTTSGAEVLVFAGKAERLLSYDKIGVPVLFAGEESEWRRLEAKNPSGTDYHAATVHVIDKFNDEGKAFLKSYQEANNKEADSDAWRGYEMMRVITAAIRETKGSGPLALREHLASAEASFPGLTGILKFKQGRALRPLFIVKLRATAALAEYAAPS